MKREILFKGISIKTGKWVYGCLDNRVKNHTVILSTSTCPTLDVQSFKNNIVDQETVCEFTGLFDSKGVKIFEGDILNVKTHVNIAEPFIEPDDYVSQEITCSVVYKNKFACFDLVTLKKDRHLTGWSLGIIDNDDSITVTGSIHDKDSK